jgi:anion transporter
MALLQKADNAGNNAQIIKWVVSFLVPFLVFISTPSLSFEISMFFALTLWAVFMWIFELIPEASVGIALPVLYLLFNLAAPNQVFAGWFTGIPWITIGGFLVGLAIVKTGFAKRLAYNMLMITGTSLLGIIAGIAIAIFFINPLVPSIAGKVALFTPLVVGVIQALEIKPGSKAAAAILLSTFFAIWAPAMGFATGGADTVLIRGIMEQSFAPIAWVTWFHHMFVPGFIWFIVSILTVFLIRPERTSVDKNLLKEKKKELGVMTRREKILTVLVVTLLVLFATDKWHGIQSQWLMVMASTLLFFPGINLLEKADMAKINYPLAFYMVGAMAIGTVSNVTGATDLFLESAVPAITGKSELLVFGGTWVFALIVNVLVTPLAALSAFTVPLGEVYNSLGIAPQVSSYIMLFGLNNFVFPYQVAPFLIVYGYGYIKLKDFINIMLIRTVASFIVLYAVVYPYWKLIGLI